MAWASSNSPLLPLRLDALPRSEAVFCLDVVVAIALASFKTSTILIYTNFQVKIMG
jgi:hypothetical protein